MTSPNLLIIEDDASLLLGLTLNLRKYYRIRPATTGSQGLAEFFRERPSLVLLDLMLPEMNGLEVLRQIRTADSKVPVIILTALGSEQDKVRGLDLGANDYITKPFSIAELLARIRAAFRAADAHEPPAIEVLRAGAIELEPETRRVRVNGTEVELSTREFDVLHFFLRRPERVLTRQQILFGVWNKDQDGNERTVDNVISSLRRKLGEETLHRHLSTVWGVGYRFVK